MANSANNAVVAGKAAGKPSGRGPSYPALTIEQAIVKAQQFWNAEKRSAAPLSAAVKHWGYSETSSSGKTTAAALLQYGLLQAEGAKESRTVKLTGRALDILLDADGSPKRLAAVQDAVLAPTLYADVLTKWQGHELPSDQTLRHHLVREKSFNEGSVDGFIKDFRASVAYAKLDKPTTTPAPYATTEGLDSVQATVETEVSDTPRSHGAALAGSGAVRASAQATLQAGEREWLRGALSRDAGYRLIVNGNMGPKEIGKLIRLLEAQKAVLDDDDVEAPESRA